MVPVLFALTPHQDLSIKIKIEIVNGRRQKKTTKRCKIVGMADTCHNTCGNCAVSPTVSPASSSEYDSYTGVGYCNNASNEHTLNNISNGEECWKKCKEKFDIHFAEFTDDECYCQETCACMGSIGDASINALFPAGFQLPSAC